MPVSSYHGQPTTGGAGPRGLKKKPVPVVSSYHGQPTTGGAGPRGPIAGAAVQALAPPAALVTHPVGQDPATTNAATTPAPSFTPGELDPDTIAALKAREGLRDTRFASLKRAFENTMARIGQSRLAAAYGRDKGYKNVNMAHAARGTLRSGLREVDRGEVLADYDRAMNGLTTDENQAINERDTGLSEETGQYVLDVANMKRTGSQAAFDRWLAQTKERPGAEPAPVAPVAPVVAGPRGMAPTTGARPLGPQPTTPIPKKKSASKGTRVMF
jgi:hypothetical protein